jgi:hypothetical protein
MMPQAPATNGNPGKIKSETPMGPSLEPLVAPIMSPSMAIEPSMAPAIPHFATVHGRAPAMSRYRRA